MTAERLAEIADRINVLDGQCRTANVGDSQRGIALELSRIATELLAALRGYPGISKGEEDDGVQDQSGGTDRG